MTLTRAAAILSLFQHVSRPAPDIPTRATGAPGSKVQAFLHSPSSEVRNVLANCAWYAVVLASGFLIPRLIDRYQGRELLGIWDLGWTLIFYVNLSAMGVGAGINRYVARYRAQEDWRAVNVTVSTCLLALLLASVIGVGASLLLSANVHHVLKSEDSKFLESARTMIFVLLLTSPLSWLSNVYNGVITGHARYDLLNLIRVLQEVLTLAGMAAVLMAGLGLVAVALVLLAGEGVGGLAKVAMARRLCPTLHIDLRLFQPRVFRDLLSFGMKSMVKDLANGFLYQVNSILVSAYLGPAVLAVYSRQRAFMLHQVKFFRQYAFVFVPRSSVLDARNDTDALRRLMVATSRYGFYLSLPIAYALMAMGGPILNLWMGPGYEAPAVLITLALGHVITVPQLAVHSILMGMARHGRPALFDLAAGVAGVAAGWFLLGPMNGGMLGAALALAVPVALSSGIAMPLYACRLLGMRFGEYAWQVARGPLLATLPIGLTLLLSRWLVPGAPLRTLLVGLGAGALVGAPIYWRWVLPPAAREWVAGRARRLLHRGGARTGASRREPG